MAKLAYRQLPCVSFDESAKRYRVTPTLTDPARPGLPDFSLTFYRMPAWYGELVAVDPIKRLLDFAQRHPEVSLAVLGPGICIKATIPGQLPIVRTQIDDLIDDLEAALDEPSRHLLLPGKHTQL